MLVHRNMDVREITTVREQMTWISAQFTYLGFDFEKKHFIPYHFFGDL
jgi:hypothetical protein